MKRTVLAFGAIAGGIVILYSVILFAILGDPARMSMKDLQMAEALGYIRYLVLLLGVVMAMIAFRRRTPGPIPYTRMLLLGVSVAAVTAVLVGGLELAYAVANPDFYDQYSRLAEESMRAGGASDADVKVFQEHQQDFAFMKNPLVMGAFYFVETFLVGSLFALVAALFTRRQEGASGMTLSEAP